MTRDLWVKRKWHDKKQQEMYSHGLLKSTRVRQSLLGFLAYFKVSPKGTGVWLSGRVIKHKVASVWSPNTTKTNKSYQQKSTSLANSKQGTSQKTRVPFYRAEKRWVKQLRKQEAPFLKHCQQLPQKAVKQKGIELTQAWLPRLLWEADKATPYSRCINLETKQLHHCGLNANKYNVSHITEWLQTPHITSISTCPWVIMFK